MSSLDAAEEEVAEVNIPSVDDVSMFIENKKILLISDFEGTTPKTHFEQFENYCKGKGEEENNGVFFLGDVFDNTAQFADNCTGDKCESPDDDDNTTCVTAENYCSLRTIKLLVDNPTTCKYVVGNRDLNKIKLLPFFSFKNNHKWWKSNDDEEKTEWSSYTEIVKYLLNKIKPSEENLWLIDDEKVKYFKPFWNNTKWKENKSSRENKNYKTNIYDRFEALFGKDGVTGTMSALVTLKCLPDEFMHYFYEEENNTMESFYNAISNEGESIDKTQVRCALTIAIFMRMLDKDLWIKEGTKPLKDFKSLDGYLYKYLEKASPAYYAVNNNNLFCFAHGGITKDFVESEGNFEKNKNEINEINKRDIETWNATYFTSVQSGGSNKIITSIHNYNSKYFTILNEFFDNLNNYDTWLIKMLTLLEISAGTNKKNPHQVKDPFDQDLDSYFDGKIYNIYGHAAAASGYVFGKSRGKDGNIIGTNTYYLNTDFASTLYKEGIYCEYGNKDLYNNNYLLCFLNTTGENITITIEGTVILKIVEKKERKGYVINNENSSLNDDKLSIDIQTPKIFIDNYIPNNTTSMTIIFDSKENLIDRIDQIDKENTTQNFKFNGFATIEGNPDKYRVYSNMFNKKKGDTLKNEKDITYPYSIFFMKEVDKIPHHHTHRTNEITISWVRHADTPNVLFENLAEDEYQYAIDIEQNFENAIAYEKLREKLLPEKLKELNCYQHEEEEQNEIETIIGLFNNLIEGYSKKWKPTINPYQVSKNDLIDPNGNTMPVKDFLQISLDYQCFRKKLLEQEENEYNAYKRLIITKIEALKNKIQKLYPISLQNINTDNIIVFLRKNTEMCNKDCSDALKMSLYEIGTQYKRENRIIKTQNPIKMPSSWMFTPTLSYAGVIEAMELGVKFATTLKELNGMNFEEYTFITSASVRTIMTSTIALITYGLLKQTSSTDYVPKTIYVVPYINENPNGGSLIDSDISNAPIPAIIIKQIINLILEWLKDNEFKHIFQGKIKKLLEGITEYKNIDIKQLDTFNSEKYVKVDTSIYKLVTMQKVESVEEKVEKLLNEVFDKEAFKSKKYFYAFTHGNLINDLRTINNKKVDKFNPFPNSCSIWSESWSVNNNNNNNRERNKNITSYEGNYDTPSKTGLKGDRGSEVRRLLKITPIDEIDNIKHYHFSSLNPKKLRGKINRIWIDYLEWWNQTLLVGGKKNKKINTRHKVKKYKLTKRKNIKNKRKLTKRKHKNKYRHFTKRK